MTSVTIAELQQQIKQLPPEDFAQLRDWIIESGVDDDWDRQVEADAAAGRLDRLAAEALSDHAAGRTDPL